MAIGQYDYHNLSHEDCRELGTFGLVAIGSIVLPIAALAGLSRDIRVLDGQIPTHSAVNERSSQVRPSIQLAATHMLHAEMQDGKYVISVET
jgi:hypothetical protein